MPASLRERGSPRGCSGLTGCRSPFLCLPLHGLTIIFQTSKWPRLSGEQSLFPAPAPFLRCFGAGPPASSDRAWGPLPAQLRQLEMQLEQEYEEKQTVLHEKQDLEGLVGTLCEQVRTRPGCCFRQSQAKQK